MGDMTTCGYIMYMKQQKILCWHLSFNYSRYQENDNIDYKILDPSRVGLYMQRGNHFMQSALSLKRRV